MWPPAPSSLPTMGTEGDKSQSPHPGEGHRARRSGEAWAAPPAPCWPSAVPVLAVSSAAAQAGASLRFQRWQGCSLQCLFLLFPQPAAFVLPGVQVSSTLFHQYCSSRYDQKSEGRNFLQKIRGCRLMVRGVGLAKLLKALEANTDGSR